MRARILIGLATCATLVAGCSSASDAPSSPRAGSPTAIAPSTTRDVESTAPTQPSKAPRSQPPRPVSVLGLAAQRQWGDGLRLGAVLEETSAYTSYAVTYRSRSATLRGEEVYTISGVLNVPRGRGPFPAVVLAHGYIDPAYYVRGQGMTRERAYLAAQGYVALHVDYRNHAESDDDPLFQTRMRLGYTADVINAVKALRRTTEVPVADDRIGTFGRSMGGGVVMKALVARPGLVQAATAWASVSSLEGQNYAQFIRPDPEDADLRDQLTGRYGTPSDNPQFWRQNSSRPYFDRITEPVLLVHGRVDDTCPPAWATATYRAMRRAGVDAQLKWYDDGHAFGPAFNAAMARTVRFFDQRLT
jgi:uncharacterized protein